MRKIGVIGIGNPLRRDDGIGIVLLERLIERKNELPGGIEYIDGGIGGINLLHLLACFDVVVIIDAVEFNGVPGEAKLFKSDELYSQKTPVKISTHESDFLKVIQFSKELKEAPDKIFIFGIQPGDVSHGTSLTRELEKNVEELVIQLQKEIIQIIH